MKVVGFTIVRNAIKFDYPAIEAISSLLPVCDEFLVSVGNSEDDTLNLIKSIQSPKIKIMETVWDDALRKGGLRLAVETNKAMDAITGADWLFYIQADEVLHEDGINNCRQEMERYKDDKSVDGLLLNYKHFYGSYSYVVEPFSRWYNNEIRIIKNNKNIRSYRDAQGFRKYSNSNPNHEELMNGGTKLNVKKVNATMFHYGWVKPPDVQRAKRNNFDEMWHNDEWVKQNSPGEGYDYNEFKGIAKFQGAHPAIMEERIKSKNWDFNPGPQKLSFKLKLSKFLLNIFGLSVGEYKNYKLI
jgi:hypothetical protein